MDQTAQSEGKKLLDKIFGFLGGRERLAQVDDYTTEVQIRSSANREPTRLKSEVILPDFIRLKQESAGASTVIFVRPQFGWMDSGAGNQDLADNVLNGISETAHRSAMMVLISMAKNPSALSYIGAGMFEWTPAKGQPLHLTFDQDTGALLDIKYRDNRSDADDQPADWREVAGLKFPFRITALRNGKELAIQTTSVIKINTHLARETLSKRP
jgi:hypothetical protein